jgi:membrane fusion protein, multidrug efflux system
MERNLRILALIPIIVLAAVLPACSGPAKGKGATDGGGRPPVAVDTARLEASRMEEKIEVVGTLEAKNEAEVKTEYSGTIAEVLVTEWVRVSKGTPLARLDSREAEASVQAARAARLQAEVASTRAARELERAEKLKVAGLATQQGLDDARTAEEAARAALASASAQLAMAETKLAKSVLRSPLDGIVASRSVNVGDYVENMGSPKPIFRIVDNRALVLTVTVPSARIASLKVGQPLSFTADAIPGREFEGRISFINPVADEASRTVKVKAEVPNPSEQLKSGQFVKGWISAGVRDKVLSVPRSALQSWDPAAHQGAVFVSEGGTAKRRVVETGAVAGDRVEIVKGLSLGDEVVTGGGFNLREGDRIRTGAAGA